MSLGYSVRLICLDAVLGKRFTRHFGLHVENESASRLWAGSLSLSFDGKQYITTAARKGFTATELLIPQASRAEKP